MLKARNSGRSGSLDDLVQVDDTYGIDRDGPVPSLQTVNDIQVSPVYIDLGEQTCLLTSNIKPLEDGHLRDTSFTFQAFGKDFILDVHLNDVLFPENFVERYYLEDGTLVTKVPESMHHHCYYHGEVRGSNSSKVAISTCRGLSGVVFDEDTTFYIEPLEGNSLKHLIYKSEDVKRPHRANCGYSNLAVIDDLPTLKRVERDVNTETKYVELYIVNDHREFEYLERDITRVMERTKEIANMMDSYYQDLNIRIALIGMEVWNQGDMIDVVSNPMRTMENFQKWRKDTLLPVSYNDNAQLLTGRTFDGSTVGMASLGGMCSSERSAGVNEDHGIHAADVASTMTHELGHNIGLLHDTTDCDCPAPEREGCVMEPASGSIPPTKWSNCNFEDLEAALRKGLGSCLFNYPRTIYGGPICGNGFQEDLEECDCGKPEDCDNPCCNAYNCTLHANATCAIGECCEDCQLKPPGTLCRDVVNKCDLPEYCRGHSPACPSNVYRQNGQPCASTDDAYCYYGACVTHDRQCLELWGGTASNSPELCYTETNRKGDELGNCGQNEDGTFVACQAKDAPCGRLMCQGGEDFPVKGSLALTRLGYVYIDKEMYVCKAASVDLGSDVPDPGMVQPGTKCADQMMCYENKCTSIAELGLTQCPYNCSFNGVCNSQNHCHCNKNWAPPYCNVAGFGGSLDSGPVRPPVEDLSTHGTMTVIFVMCLLVIPALLVIIICMLYRRSQIKAWWHARQYTATSAESCTEVKPVPQMLKTHKLTSASLHPDSQKIQVPKTKPVVKNQNRPIHRVPYTGSFDRKSLERTSSERKPSDNFIEISLNEDQNKTVPPRPAAPPLRPAAPPVVNTHIGKQKPLPPPKPNITPGVGHGTSPSGSLERNTPPRPTSLPLRANVPARRAPPRPNFKRHNPNQTVC
uniref:Disintegrin and metalloproteinase domain-containing protein 12-like n=1 Tax=Saccoglossus kowalevskii TaxID=10224 RepID=A0ABM0MLX0_SACKO|nr:PREDICTED: disintegrin and metalloproteinase domain-containing protein 12-like [Saccoglossus kowalevskii]